MSVPPIVLYVNFYTDKSSSRQQEIVHCQHMNGKLESIDQIYMVVDDVEKYKQWKIDYPKIELHYMSSRPTFTDFFKLANQTQNHPQQINIIANTDIYFTSSLDKLKTFEWKNRALCLSRQDMITSYSQDVWAWQGLMKNISSQSSFFLGIPGCDNRIAYVLHSNGYKLHNPAKTIIAHHVHESMVRNYTESNRIQEEGIFVEPTHLGEHTDIHFTQKNEPCKSRSKAKSRSRNKFNSVPFKQFTRSQSVIAVRKQSIYSSQRNHSVIRKDNVRMSPVHTTKPIQIRQARFFHPSTNRISQRMSKRQQRFGRINVRRNLAKRYILTTVRKRK
jgi:hypothetical protein